MGFPYRPPGVDAHINFDLASARMSTCTRLGVEFGAGEQYQDYLRAALLGRGMLANPLLR